MQDIIIKKKVNTGEEKVEINKGSITPTKEPGNNPETIEWSIAEHTFKEKTNDWYWSVGVVTLALVVLSYFMKNFLFAVISLIGGISIFILGLKKPFTLHNKVTQKGVGSDDRFFMFDDIESFCIDEGVPEEPRLFLKMKSGIASHAILPIHEEDKDKIQNFLREHLKEEVSEEPFSSILIRILGI